MQAMTSPDTLTPVRYAIMHTADLAVVARPVTADERAECAALLAAAAGMSDAEFAAYVGVPADMGSELRRLLGDGGAR